MWQVLQDGWNNQPAKLFMVMTNTDNLILRCFFCLVVFFAFCNFHNHYMHAPSLYKLSSLVSTHSATGFRLRRILSSWHDVSESAD